MTKVRNGKWLLFGAALILAVSAFVYAAYDFAGARTFLARGLDAAAIFSPQVVGMLGIGWKVLARIGYTDQRNAWGVLLAIALGLGVISHLFLVLGLVGLLYPVTAWIVFSALGMIGVVEIWVRRAAYRDLLRSAFQKLDDLPLLSSLGLVILSIYLLYPVLADVFVPPLENDEIAYHLPIPQIFIANHRIVSIPFIPYSNWPTGFELIYTFQLLLTTDVLAHLMTYLTYLLTVGAAAVYVRRTSGGRAAIVVSLLIAGVVTYLNLSGTGMIDVPVAMFTYFAVLTWLGWVRGGESSSLILSAIFAGFAASIKLNAAVFAGIIGLFVLIKHVFGGQFRAGIAEFVRYGLVSGAVVLPWYLKSWIVAGSPVWPFLSEIFGAQHWDAVAQGYLMEFIRAPNRPLTILNWVTGFVDLALNPDQYGFSYRLGPSLMLFSPFLISAFFLKRVDRSVFLAAGGMFIALYTNWFLTTQQNRFFLPAVPLFATLVGMGLGRLFKLESKPLRLILFSALLIYFAAGSWVFKGEERALISDNWMYQTGKVSKDEYLRANLAIFEAVEFLNTMTASDAFVLLALYEPRGYYLERDYFWLNPISQRVIRIEAYPSSEAFRRDLIAAGFTHILFNPRWLAQLDEIKYSSIYTPMLFEVLEQSNQVFIANGIRVYELAGSD